MNIIEIIEKAKDRYKNGDSLQIKRECWEDSKYIYFDVDGTFWWPDACICRFRADDFSYTDWEVV